MKLPSIYLKMRVLGAIDTAPGKTRHERVHQVAAMTFLDEEGNSRQFTWRTIQTWFYRYKNHGITGMTPRPRSDKGHTRKVTPEELLEAINAARPHFPTNRTNKMAIYRFCVEKGLLDPDLIAQTTFYRFVREYDLLAPTDTDHKQRLAFSMKYANQLWQADTLVGPYCNAGGTKKQARLIAFLDDASRVLCHGEFFFEENTDTLIQALRAAFYKRGIPEQLLVDNGSIYCSQEITLVCARVGCLLRHTAVRDAAASRAKDARYEAIVSMLLQLYSSLECGRRLHQAGEGRAGAGTGRPAVPVPARNGGTDALLRVAVAADADLRLSGPHARRGMPRPGSEPGGGRPAAPRVDPGGGPVVGGVSSRWQPRPGAPEPGPGADRAGREAGIKEFKNAIDEGPYAEARARLDDPGMALWARAGEKAHRLALIYACSADRENPVITLEAAQWAIAFARHQTLRMLHMVHRHASESEFDAKRKRLLDVLERWRGLHGDEWMPGHKLNRQVPWSVREHEEVRDALLQQCLIEYRTTAVGNKGGRPGAVYRLRPTREAR